MWQLSRKNNRLKKVSGQKCWRHIKIWIDYESRCKRFCQTSCLPEKSLYSDLITFANRKRKYIKKKLQGFYNYIYVSQKLVIS